MRIKWMLLALASLCGLVARADTVHVVAQELKADSVLQLRQGVANIWAENLLLAQAAPDCFYCGTISLELSIDAVLRAVTIEADPVFGAGLSWCDRQNCTIANAQSILAINASATISITHDHLDFGEVPVATSEPGVCLQCLAALGLLLWLRKFKPAH